MKIAHTSDWHLGKKLYSHDWGVQHKEFLDWLISKLVEEEIDLLLISGDIFDSPMPPHDSIKLFYDFLASIPKTTKVNIISGNHDAGKFIEVPSALTGEHIQLDGLTFKSDETIDQLIERLTHQYQTESENLILFNLPYFRNWEMKNILKQLDGEQESLGDQIIEDFDLEKQLGEFFKKVIAYIKTLKSKDKEDFFFFQGHHLFGSFGLSGSELGLHLSGIDSIPTKLLKDFDYLALGHIHKKQMISKASPIALYPGSPLPFRFSESPNKSIHIIEAKEGLKLKEVKTEPVFDFKRIALSEESGSIRDQLDELPSVDLLTLTECSVSFKSPNHQQVEDIKSVLKDKGYTLLNMMATINEEDDERAKQETIEGLSTNELFIKYYKEKTESSEEIGRASCRERVCMFV